MNSQPEGNPDKWTYGDADKFLEPLTNKEARSIRRRAKAAFQRLHGLLAAGKIGDRRPSDITDVK